MGGDSQRLYNIEQHVLSMLSAQGKPIHQKTSAIGLTESVASDFEFRGLRITHLRNECRYPGQKGYSSTFIIRGDEDSIDRTIAHLDKQYGHAESTLPMQQSSGLKPERLLFLYFVAPKATDVSGFLRGQLGHGA